MYVTVTLLIKSPPVLVLSHGISVGQLVKGQFIAYVFTQCITIPNKVKMKFNVGSKSAKSSTLLPNELQNFEEILLSSYNTHLCEN